MKKIAPSILSADFTNLAAELAAIEEAKADYVHVDVMDGHFVPNLTIGPLVVEAIRRATSLPLDVHLMIENPQNFISAFAKAGSDIITVHIETTENLEEVVASIKEFGIRAGLALNPDTPVKKIEPYIKLADLVLVMSVHPGFSGQEFIKSTFQKIRRVSRLVDRLNPEAELEVDGGIKVGNIKQVSDAGADVFVSGSGIFGTDDYKKTIEAMRKELGEKEIGEEF